MKCLALMLLLVTSTVFAQQEGLSQAGVQSLINDSLASKWYERIQFKGYAHFRYNRSFETNPNLSCASCDKSVGNKQGFFFRRARLTFFGDMNDKVSIYIQADYSSDALAGSPAGTQQNYLQLRDAYFDYHLDEAKEFRIRSGLSKVPFGFENLQSSANRAPLDRNDAFNSGVANERDMGIFVLYAPSEIRKNFKELSVLKGSGDYGMVAIGAYNGQTMNRAEKNNDLHRVARLTYPYKTSRGQFIEASIQGYEGKYNSSDNQDTYEQRTGVSLIYYPQPFGIQAEYNEGVGPEFDHTTNTIQKQKLHGGYAMINYQFNKGKNRYFPYLRYQDYNGGKKLETGATSTRVNEWEIGTEWQPNPAFELTVAYMISDRETQSTATNKTHEKGNVLRMQAQFNY